MPSSETIELVPLHNATLWTTTQGTSPPVIWCHGGPGLWDYLEPVATMLQDSMSVYRYDQRGCGRSTGGEPYTVAQSIADLEALRQHWGLERWTVAGHSWGATLALAYALAHPHRVDALIYCSGTGIDSSWRPAYREERARRLSPAGIQELRAAAERWETEGALEAERAYCEIAWSTDFADWPAGRAQARHLLVGDLRINREANKHLGQDAARFEESITLPQLQSLKLPALIVHGAKDPRPLWAAERVAEHLPISELVVLPNSGHLPWLEEPIPLQQALLKFARRI